MSPDDSGGRYDPQDKPGLAHLVEHAVFELSPGGSTYASSLASFSLQYNAFTTPDETHFQVLTLTDGVAPRSESHDG